MRFPSLKKTQHRARPRSWMCDSTTSQAATRRDLVQVAGAAIAAASTLSISDLNDVAVAAAMPTTRSAGAVTESGETSVWGHQRWCGLGWRREKFVPGLAVSCRRCAAACPGLTSAKKTLLLFFIFLSGR